MSDDVWRELPATPTGFPGYTLLKRGTREIACVGTGDAVRKAMSDHAENNLRLRVDSAVAVP